MNIQTTLYPDSRVIYNSDNHILTIMSSNNKFELKVHPMVLEGIVENLSEELKLKEDE
ncbi:hypothetical protein [Virgibacillus profundi]|uniref:hypothetical protein n=1 Tax=Virgibacillus profundi TaxID=2024555 RepID=UPI0013FD299D|nr:hypothetical protein [Virgibacillus profundi]